MIGPRSMVALSGLALAMASCGGNVVVDAQTSGATAAGGDGTAAATDTFIVVGDGATPCTGALDIADNWTSTTTTFAVSGGTCTGSVACPNGDDIPCGPAEIAAQTCTYALSNANNTLVLTCPQGNGPITYTRQ